MKVAQFCTKYVVTLNSSLYLYSVVRLLFTLEYSRVLLCTICTKQLPTEQFCILTPPNMACPSLLLNSGHTMPQVMPQPALGPS